MLDVYEGISPVEVYVKGIAICHIGVKRPKRAKEGRIYFMAVKKFIAIC